MPDLGKMSKAWEARNEHRISLTDVVKIMVIKICAMILHPRSEWVNRIMLLLGQPGIGKSTVLRKMVDKLADRSGKLWRAHLLHVGTRGMEDNTGLPILKKVGDKDVAGWAAPEQIPGAVHWLDEKGEPKGWTLGILDELPSAQPSVQDQIRELIDGHVPGSGDPVDPQCVYVAAGNPPEAQHVTVQVIDSAIEARLKVYTVVPTDDELLQVWSDPHMMPDILFKFLTMNTGVIKHLSPSEWEGVGKDAQYVLEGGGSINEAINEIADELYEAPDVVEVLRKFFAFGDDPYHYPIRGLKLLTADKDDFADCMDIMKRWVADNKDGHLGATSNDLLRALKLTPAEELKKNKRAAENTVHVLEFLIQAGRPDMVKAVLEAVYETPLVGPVGSKIRKSKHLSTMNDVADRVDAFSEKLGAASGR